MQIGPQIIAAIVGAVATLTVAYLTSKFTEQRSKRELLGAKQRELLGAKLEILATHIGDVYKTIYAWQRHFESEKFFEEKPKSFSTSMKLEAFLPLSEAHVLISLYFPALMGKHDEIKIQITQLHNTAIQTLSVLEHFQKRCMNEGELGISASLSDAFKHTNKYKEYVKAWEEQGEAVFKSLYAFDEAISEHARRLHLHEVPERLPWPGGSAPLLHTLDKFSWVPFAVVIFSFIFLPLSSRETKSMIVLGLIFTAAPTFALISSFFNYPWKRILEAIVSILYFAFLVVVINHDQPGASWNLFLAISFQALGSLIKIWLLIHHRKLATNRPPVKPSTSINDCSSADTRIP